MSPLEPEEETDEEEIDHELTIASETSDVLGTSFMGQPEIAGHCADDSLAESSFVSSDMGSDEDSGLDRSAHAKEVDRENGGYSDEDGSEDDEGSILEGSSPVIGLDEEADGYSDEDVTEEEEEEDDGEEDEEEEEDGEEADSSFNVTTSSISEPTSPQRTTVSPRKSAARTPSKASPKRSTSKPLGESVRQAMAMEEDESIEFIELVPGKTPAKKKRALGKQKIVTEDDVSAPIGGAEVRRMVRM